MIARYEQYLRSRLVLVRRLPELQGKVLGCFCTPQLCHGDVLAAYADSLARTGAIPPTLLFSV